MNGNKCAFLLFYRLLTCIDFCDLSMMHLPYSMLRKLVVCSVAEMSELVIKSVNQTNPNRRQFRAVARDSCGETFEPPVSDMMFFGTVNENIVVVGSCQVAAAERTKATESTDSDSNYAHIINYVFTRPRFQRHGYGKRLVLYMEEKMRHEVQDRPFRLRSCRQAVDFFEKLGYRCVSEPVQPVCPGSKRFAELYSMEKVATAQ